MANETTITTLATLIPDVIEEMAIETAATQKVFRPVLGRPGITLFDFTGVGTNLDINQMGTVAFGALTEATAPSNQAYTTTKRTLTPIYLGGTLFVSHQAKNRAQMDPMAQIADAVATAWVDLEDGNDTYGWSGQYADADTSGPDHTIGTDAVPLNAAIVRQAVQLLMTAKAPRPYNLFIDPLQWGELLTDTVARDLLKDNGTQPDGFRAVEGVRMDQFIGKIFGCNIWVVPSGMAESSGLHAMMVADKALGLAYENIATDLSPTLSELNIEADWDGQARGWYVDFTVSMDIGGLVKTASNNNWMVNIIS